MVAFPAFFVRTSHLVLPNQTVPLSSLILLSYCFGSLGTEDFSTASFIICLVSGIALIKIFVIDNNKRV